MSEWRHRPAELPKARLDPKPVWCAFCGSLDSPWPCDAEQMRLRAEAAEGALRDGAIPAMRFAARRLAAIEGERQTADDLRADADKIEIIARAALSGEAPDRDGELRAFVEELADPIGGLNLLGNLVNEWSQDEDHPNVSALLWDYAATATRLTGGIEAASARLRAPSLEGARHPEAGERE